MWLEILTIREHEIIILLSNILIYSYFYGQKEKGVKIRVSYDRYAKFTRIIAFSFLCHFHTFYISDGKIGCQMQGSNQKFVLIMCWVL